MVIKKRKLPLPVSIHSTEFGVPFVFFNLVDSEVHQLVRFGGKALVLNLETNVAEELPSTDTKVIELRGRVDVRY
jgi:hypothetical protein